MFNSRLNFKKKLIVLAALTQISPQILMATEGDFINANEKYTANYFEFVENSQTLINEANSIAWKRNQLMKQLDSDKYQVTLLKRRVSNLTADLNNFGSRRSSLDSQIQGLRKEMQSIQDEAYERGFVLEGQRASRANLSQTLNRISDREFRLNDQIRDLRLDIQDANNNPRLRRINNKVRDLGITVRDGETQVQNLRSKIKSNKRSIDSLQKNIPALRKRIQDLPARQAHLESILPAAQARKTQADIRWQAKKRRHCSIHKSCRRARREMERANKALAAINVELTDIRNGKTKSNLKKNIKDSKAKIIVLKDRNTKMKGLRQTLLADLPRQKQELAKLRRRLTRVHNEVIAPLEQQISDKQRRLQKTSQRRNSVQQIISSMDNVAVRINSVEEKIADLPRVENSLRAQLNTAKASIVPAQDKVSQSQISVNIAIQKVMDNKTERKKENELMALLEKENEEALVNFYAEEN